MTPMPQHDTGEAVDANGYPLEYRICTYCGRGFWIRELAIKDTCEKLACNLKADKAERQRLMTADELAAYKAAAEKFYSAPQPDSPGVAKPRALKPISKAAPYRPDPELDEIARRMDRNP